MKITLENFRKIQEFKKLGLSQKRRRRIYRLRCQVSENGGT